MARPSRFSPEVRERAVRMVFEHAQEHRSQWAAITSSTWVRTLPRSLAERHDAHQHRST
jgi:transposase